MTCPTCDDTGWKPVETGGVRRVVRCDCWREQIGQRRLTESNIPKRYQHCTLDNFVAGYGQRFQFRRMQIHDLRLTAKLPDGSPLEIKKEFAAGGLAGALGGKR